MKNKNNFVIATMACITTTILYKFYKHYHIKKKINEAISKFNRNEDTINDFLYLYKAENSKNISNYLALSYYRKASYTEALKYAKSDKLIYECYMAMKKYRNAIICGFQIFVTRNDDKMRDRIRNVMQLYVNEQVENHKVEKLSVLVYKDCFETFPLIFKDFEGKGSKKIKEFGEDASVKSADEAKEEIEAVYTRSTQSYEAIREGGRKANKHEKIATPESSIFKSEEIQKTTSGFTITHDRHIRDAVYTKIKTYLGIGHIEGLKKYTKFRKDNLSNFINLLTGLIENKMAEVIRKTELFEGYTDNYHYEQKIYTYCRVVIDFYNQKTNNYKHRDISTMFYALQLKTAPMDSSIFLTGMYPFVYHFLLQNNFYMVDEAYMLFPTDPKILSLACEIYISGKRYEKADDCIANMKKYCSKDPRTYICMFYKSRIKSEDGLVHLLKAECIDDKYYKTYLLLSNYYAEVNTDLCSKYLKKAKMCCNNYDALSEIFELEIMHEAKKILSSSLC